MQPVYWKLGMDRGPHAIAGECKHAPPFLGWSFRGQFAARVLKFRNGLPAACNSCSGIFNESRLPEKANRSGTECAAHPQKAHSCRRAESTYRVTISGPPRGPSVGLLNRVVLIGGRNAAEM